MVLGYKKQFPWGTPTEFKRKILEGIKKHTIREDAHDRWHKGRKINHCHGVRTKSFDNFHNNECTGNQTIRIYWILNTAYVYINHILIGKYNKVFELSFSHEIDMLARNDGFDSTADFFKWFDKKTKGKIIHWTPLRY
jgi:hypothetical protein